MQKIIPERLKKGDTVMIIAPARGTKIIGQDTRRIAEERLTSLGLKVVFAPNSIDSNWDYMGNVLQIFMQRLRTAQLRRF
jgi:muramoyltetrapeptide carboxypeptidase LdcA involved in peptidoglycan recycling